MNRTELADKLNATPGFKELMCRVAEDRLARAVMQDSAKGKGKVRVRLAGAPSEAEMALDRLLVSVGLPAQVTS